MPVNGHFHENVFYLYTHFSFSALKIPLTTKLSFMKTKTTLQFAMVVLVLCNLTSRAQGIEDMVQKPAGNEYLLKHLSVSLKVSTLGGGLEVATSLSHQFNLRLAGNYFKTSRDFSFTLLDLDTHLKLSSLNLFADWHPGGQEKLFHLSGGLLFSGNKAELTGRSTKSYQLGGYLISPDDMGELTMHLYTRKVNPYLGLGFGSAIPQKRVSFKLEFGTVFHGQPKADLEASNMIKLTAEQEEIVASNLSGYKFWPVLSMQLCFRIF